jgi:hypothetical protein
MGILQGFQGAGMRVEGSVPGEHGPVEAAVAVDLFSQRPPGVTGTGDIGGARRRCRFKRCVLVSHARCLGAGVRALEARGGRRCHGLVERRPRDERVVRRGLGIRRRRGGTETAAAGSIIERWCCRWHRCRFGGEPRRLDEVLRLRRGDVGLNVGAGTRRWPRHEQLHRQHADEHAEQRGQKPEQQFGLSSHAQSAITGGRPPRLRRAGVS